MKTKLSSIYCILFVFLTGTTQELALVRENDLFGYINTNGEYEIEPKFEVAKSFSENYASVKVGDKWGLINPKGEFVIQPTYDRLKQFNSGYVLALKNDQWNYISPNEEILKINHTIEKYYDFNDGVAFFRSGDKIGLLGTDGKLVLPPTYNLIKPFKNGYAKVKTGKLWGMIHKSGKEHIPVKYLEIGNYHNEIIWARTDDGFGLIKEGVFSLIPGATKIWDFNKSSNLTRARARKKIGFINKKGEWIINPIYKKVKPFKNDLAPVYNDGLWGYIDTTGKTVIQPTFIDAELFADNGLAAIKVDKKWGFINKEGIVVIPITYLITPGLSIFKANKQKGFVNGLARVKFNDTWGFIKKDGTVLNKWYQNAELFTRIKE